VLEASFRELLIIGPMVCGVLFSITFFFGWLVGCTRGVGEKMVVWVKDINNAADIGNALEQGSDKDLLESSPTEP